MRLADKHPEYEVYNWNGKQVYPEEAKWDDKYGLSVLGEGEYSESGYTEWCRNQYSEDWKLYWCWDENPDARRLFVV